MGGVTMVEMQLFCTRLNTQIGVKRQFCKPMRVGSVKGFVLVCNLAVSGVCDQVCELNPRMKNTSRIPTHVL